MFYIFKLIRNVIFTLLTIISHLPLTVLYFWKCIVTYFVSKALKDLSPMSAIDYLVAICLDFDIESTKSKNLNGNLGITCKLNGKVDGEQFFQIFERNVINIDYTKDLDPNHKHIRFHKSIQRVGGYWFFKTFPNRLKYADHVTCATLTNNSSYQEEVCKWLKIRYDIKKCPLWSILLLYREESHDTIFAFKIHHLLADGYSVMHILDLLTNTQYKYQVKDFNDSRWEKFKIFTESSYNLVKHQLQLAMVSQSPLVGKKNEDEIFLTHVTVPLEFVKNVRQKTGVRFQSVMLHLILNFINSVIENSTDDKKNLPEKIIITNSLPWPKHSRDELCNHATGATFTFKIRDKGCAHQESLTDINNIFEGFYEKYLDRAVHNLSLPLASIPLKCIDFKFLQNYMVGKLTGFYVHLIGSDEYSHVFDIQCQDVNLFTVPPKQKGITINCLTTSNEVRMSILGPKSVFSSQEEAEIFVQETIQRQITEMAETIENFVKPA